MTKAEEILAAIDEGKSDAELMELEENLALHV